MAKKEKGGRKTRLARGACQSPPSGVIRTGGDVRISNFLLWQAAYTELYVTPTLWPDFGKDDLVKAIEAYHSRQRRFGKVLDE